MPIDKQKLLQIQKTAKSIKCADTQDVMSELATTLADTETLVASHANSQAVPFVIWNDFFNSYGTLSPKLTQSSYRYKWGDKIFVDFGCGNIQTELSFPHPAIVLYNFSNSVIVVPTTSDDNPNDLSSDIEGVIIKAKKDENIFPKDTIINIHQIRAINKKRIVKNLKCNVANYIMDDEEISRQNSIHGQNSFLKGMDLLSCIKTKVAYIFASQELQNRDTKLLQQQKQIEILQRELSAAEAQLSSLAAHLQKIVNEPLAHTD